MKPNDGGFRGDGYEVRPIKSSIGKAFIREHHYSHSCHNGPMCYGLVTEERLIGVLAFATPCSENVRRSVYGPGREGEVTELHRLVILDETRTNAESWFISRALRQLKRDRPKYSAVVSFSDATEGHTGTIYQATNAIYQGSTSKAWFYRDGEGRLRHPRQNGHNVTVAEATDKGWVRERRDAKRRYLFLLGGKAERRKNRAALVRESYPYPERE